jgi:long-chain acyl-CoA synthetase
MQVIQGPSYFKVRSFANLREMLDQCVDLYGPMPAFRFREQLKSDPVSRSYSECRADCQALGTTLLHMGLGGGRLAIVGENSYIWCVAHVATVNGVGIAVPLDRLLPEEELIGLLERGEVDAVLYDASFQAVMEKAAGLLPRLRHLICLRPDRLKSDLAITWVAPDGLADANDGPSFYQLPDLLTTGQQLLHNGDQSYTGMAIDPDALVSLLFTSGTTSQAKAVMLSHHNICADIRGLAGVVHLPAGIRMLSVLPLHHTFENTCGLFMALYVGGTIHECDGLRYIQKNMQEYGIEMIIGVPLLFSNFYVKIQDSLKKAGKDKLIARMIPLTQALRRVGIDLRRIIYKQILESFGGCLYMGICGAAPIDPEIIRFFDAIGVRILQGYGLTETAPVVSGCNSKIFVPGTVGRPLSGMSIAIDSENPGEPGEILIRGENVMLGYYKDNAATAEAIDSAGWFHSGDIGVLDPKTRCISITGRVKSMIVLKTGKKIFPEEIEHLIGQFNFIKESLVWGEKDSEGEVTISAKLVVDKEALEQKTGQAADDNTIRQHLEQLIRDINASLPSFKGIRQYVFSFQEMVKTTTLKIRRPIEIGLIGDLMQKQKLKWRELTGKNVDQLAAAPAPPTVGKAPDQGNGGPNHVK